MSETVEGQVPVESVKVLNACEVATEEANGCEAANGNAENLSKETVVEAEPVVVEGGSAVSKSKKKRSRQKKKQAANGDQANSAQPEPLSIQDLKAALTYMDRSKEAKPEAKEWKFWDTQPVPKFGDKSDEVGPIEEDKKEVRQMPFSLPASFEWDTLDLSDDSQVVEVYKLLNENYVEDEDNMFRFDYSSEFLQWALRPPGWQRDWHCGVRVKSNRKLVGFISAVPATMNVHGRTQKMVEINFLCVHKKLRSKRVAPVLIKEITRRVNIKGLFQATYTAGVLLPKPVAKCRYYHRPLNPRKLVDIKFSHIGRNQTMQRMQKLMRLPEHTSIKGMRPMEAKDVGACHKLLSDYLSKFKLSPVFEPEEVRHYFLPRSGIIETYVVEDEQGEITDMSSFFTLPSSVMHHPEHKSMKAAYNYYTVATKHELKDLMKDMLVVAKQKDHDVFNTLDLMENQKFIKDLKFGIGDGNLHYYLYNFKCPEMEEQEIGLVLQ